MKLSLSRLGAGKFLFLNMFIFLFVCFCAASPTMAEQKKEPEAIDLSNMDWSDEPETPAGDDFSESSWEDEEEDQATLDEDDSFMTMTKAEEDALEGQEKRIHIYGFLLFIGYILGALFTGYFTRNRKLAVDYPPELLIILHTLWPLEWVFMLFAGQKVR